MVFDAAMKISGGKVLQWHREGVPIPDGLQGLNPEGEPTTDPAEVLQGVILPIGLHKGARLTIMVEMLSGMLGGGGFVHGGRPEHGAWEMQSYSQCCIAIDVEHFMPLAEVKRRVAAYVAAIKLRPLAPGQTELLAPGELAHRSMQACRELGVPLEDDVRAELQACAARLGLTPPF